MASSASHESEEMEDGLGTTTWDIYEQERPARQRMHAPKPITSLPPSREPSKQMQRRADSYGHLQTAPNGIVYNTTSDNPMPQRIQQHKPMIKKEEYIGLSGKRGIGQQRSRIEEPKEVSGQTLLKELDGKDSMNERSFIPRQQVHEELSNMGDQLRFISYHPHGDDTEDYQSTGETECGNEHSQEFPDPETETNAPSEGLFVREDTIFEQSAPYRITQRSYPSQETLREYHENSRAESTSSQLSTFHPVLATNLRNNVQRISLNSQYDIQRKRRFNPPSPEFDQPPVETTVGSGLRNSRYSGATDELEWHVSKKRAGPTRVEKVTQASLLKRGLRKGQEETVVKRGYGVNDPENVEIVNLKETTNMSFQAIADYLNKKRVDDGRNPTLTMTGVNGRYNRTAPVLFQSQGRIFVPLSQRKKDNPDAGIHGKTRNADTLDNATWDEDLDLKLVQIVRQYDAEKWTVVKQRFEEETGYHVNDNEQLAKRYNLL